MIREVVDAALSQDIFEWLGLIAGIIYVLLAAKEKALCWVFGIVSCSLIAYKDITSYKLYSDAILQTFYVFMGIWGLYVWLVKKNIQQNNRIQILSIRKHFFWWIILIIISFPLGFIMNSYTDASFSYLDSLTTVFAIFATFLLVKKYVGNWLYWIGINLVYVYIYGSGGGFLFAFLSVIYTVIAIYGYWNWSRRMKITNTSGGDTPF